MLVAGKSYGLTVSPEIFAEKTWKTGIAAIVQTNGYIVIDRIIPSELFDTAYIVDGRDEYELTSDLWKWFVEVTPADGEFTPVEEPKSDKREMVSEVNPETFNLPNLRNMSLHGGMYAVDVKKLDIPVYNPTDANKTLRIDSDYAKAFTDINIVDPCSKSGNYLRFALNHLFNGGTIYQIDTESSIDLQEESIKKLFDLHNQLEAINNLELLVETERKRIVKELEPYEKKNESRNLRNT